MSDWTDDEKAMLLKADILSRLVVAELLSLPTEEAMLVAAFILADVLAVRAKDEAHALKGLDISCGFIRARIPQTLKEIENEIAIEESKRHVKQ